MKTKIDIEEYNKYTEYRKEINKIKLEDLEIPSLTIKEETRQDLKMVGLDTYICIEMLLDGFIGFEEELK